MGPLVKFIGEFYRGIGRKVFQKNHEVAISLSFPSFSLSVCENMAILQFASL